MHKCMHKILNCKTIKSILHASCLHVLRLGLWAYDGWNNLNLGMNSKNEFSQLLCNYVSDSMILT